MTRIFAIVGLLLIPMPSTHGADWPHWRGPNRDGTTEEDSGWDANAWPPQELWRTNVGIGSTSPIIVNGNVYTMGWASNADRVICLDAEGGKEKWSVTYKCPKFGRNAVGDQTLYAGPTSTPEFDPETSFLFTLSTDGDLACWDTTKRGRSIWELNLYDRYQMPKRPPVDTSKQRDYGYTSAPLIVGDELLVEVGGSAGTIVAFDKRTGNQLWASEAKDLAGHTGGPALMKVNNIPCLAVLTFNGFLVIRLDEEHRGETLAQYPYQTEFANSITSPAVLGSDVLLTSGYNHKAMTKLHIDLEGAHNVWTRPRILSKVCTPVFLDGRAYWSWNYAHCLDVQTGELLWKGRTGGTDGSCVVTSDKRIIVWANRGELFLVESAERSPNACQILSRTGRLFRKEVWPHVALSGGELLCKDRVGNLACLALTARAEAPREQQAASAGGPAPGGDGTGRVIEWVAGMGVAAIGPMGAQSPKLKLRPRGNATVTPEGKLSLADGAFLVEGANAGLLDQCRHSGELTVEAVLRTESLQQRGPARIVSFSVDPYHRNFTLGQQNDRLILRLRTPQTGDNGMKPETTLCSIRKSAEHHVLVTYRNGELVCYLDGQLAMRSDAVHGKFGNWEPMHLILGDEFQDNRDWKGTLSRVTVLSRFVATREAAERFAKRSAVPKEKRPTQPAPAPGGKTTAEPPKTQPISHTRGSVELTELADWQGQPSYRIETEMGTAVYHRQGAGFASLLDRDGNDWISFRPTGGAAGSYRGIPNLPIQAGGFHPGATTCKTTAGTSTPDRVVLNSRTDDGKWSGRWTIMSEIAVFDLAQTALPYWFLYEGTPGGTYDETQTWMMDSTGRRQYGTKRWERRLPEPRWLCFGTNTSPRVLFLADLTPRPRETTDSFWSMQKNMTVFGFGRALSRNEGRWHHLKQTPARFAVGFVESTDHAEIAEHIRRVCRGLLLQPSRD
ncbi:MAG: PQQ-binding-like beta-propeller repeat protein [Lentisphaerae bacterium]|nr:PQQ-binding-like beta-propeller repeat protein [Lentisphaerota bacterium]